MSLKSLLTDPLRERPLILDGAVGTMLYRPEFGEMRSFFSERLNLTDPNAVRKLHEAYLHSGADIISTNSFNANLRSTGTDLTVTEITKCNKVAVELAKEAIEMHGREDTYIAGVIGPSVFNVNSTYSDADVKDCFYPQVEGLMSGGADCLLVESVYHLPSTLQLLQLIKSVAPDIPLWVSLSPFNDQFSLSSGETLKETVTQILTYQPTCVGINCLNPDDAIVAYKLLQLPETVLPTIHPNAGIPDKNNHYPASMKSVVSTLSFIDTSLPAVVGGCCGTTPEYIAMLSASF